MGSTGGDIWSVTAAQSRPVVSLPPRCTKGMEINMSFTTTSFTWHWLLLLGCLTLGWFLRALGLTAKKTWVSIYKPVSGPGSGLLKTWTPPCHVVSRVDGQSGEESHTEGPRMRHSGRRDEGQSSQKIPAWISTSIKCPIQQVPKHYAERCSLEVLPEPALLSSPAIWPTQCPSII